MAVAFNQKNICFKSNGGIVLGVVFDAEKAALITGAPDNSKIVLRQKKQKEVPIDIWSFVVRNENVFADGGYEVALDDLDPDGRCLVINDLFVLEALQGTGVLKRMFPIIVNAAKDLSVKRIKLDAAKGLGGLCENIKVFGSVVWPKFGFDCDLELSTDQRDSLPFELRDLDVKRLQDLWSSSLWPVDPKSIKEQWWLKNIPNLILFFDLEDPVFGERLATYLAKKGVSGILCKRVWV